MTNNAQVVGAHNLTIGFPDCEGEITKDADGVNVPKGCKRKVDCKKGEYVFSDPGCGILLSQEYVKNVRSVIMEHMRLMVDVE